MLLFKVIVTQFVPLAVPPTFGITVEAGKNAVDAIDAIVPKTGLCKIELTPVVAVQSALT